jgi:hypothetical protein
VIDLSKTQWRLLGAVAFVGIVVAVGVVVMKVTSDNGSSSHQLNHVAYARLWSGTTVGSRLDAVLAKWPEPYQTYSDGFKNQCYEWWDRPLSLYNLCFKKGVLVTKSLA